MTEFLRQVAGHYLENLAGDISSLCFVFPNRRSMVFFRKYLCEAVSRRGGAPVLSPQMTTMGDLFQKASGMHKAERIHLIIKLYDCYRKLNPGAEPLDDFIFWGDVLLSDFDDVDKYLADAERLFTNVSDFNSLQDDLSWLSSEQREALSRFIQHFHRTGSDGSGEPSSKEMNVKERFSRIWNILYPLYSDFNETLRSEGLCYEGMAYRSLVQAIKEGSAVDVMASVYPGVSRFVTVGLNALNECEKFLLRRLRDAGIADFCWDYEGEWIRDPRNASSRFMSQNIIDFPQTDFLLCPVAHCSLEAPSGGPGDTSPGDRAKRREAPTSKFKIISVPSSVGQVKQIPAILRQIADSCHGGDISKVGTDTAIVLPDENLLMSVLNTIPEEIKDINVTMGYPMGGSAFFSLMSDIMALQLHLRSKDGKWYFYHRQVWSIFSNSIFSSLLEPEALEAATAVKAGVRYYIPQEELKWNPLSEIIFRPVVTDPKLADAGMTRKIQEYQKEVILALASQLRERPGMSLELEFAQEYYLSIVRLQAEHLPVLPATYARLVSQMVSGVSVPFRGEPLRGLQIMGPLETRSLDFENLIILSCNEGLFPRRSVSSSFIPPELRRGFSLPTYEYQDAVWAYYFYRMIHRPSRVWMLCDSRTAGIRSGEESRYIKQLELHFGVKTERCTARAEITFPSGEDAIQKTAEDIEELKKGHLSASSLNCYLDCQAKFYYQAVRHLSEPAEVSESLDAGMIGNVYHKTMQAIYSGPAAMAPDFIMERENLKSIARLETVSREYIESWLKREKDIRARVRALIMTELHSLEVSGRDLVYENMVVRYVRKTLERDLELMKDYGTMAFRILGLEQLRYWSLGDYRFKGYIDRMDSFTEGEFRVVDYKTGRVEDADIDISDDNAGEIVEKLFRGDPDSRPKYAFQLFLYDMYVERERAGRKVLNTIYPVTDLFVNQVRNVPVSRKFVSLMKEELTALLNEISDLGKPFLRNGTEKKCTYCDFKTICGR
jgi:CRISPR/Cas system-associated exonuclease Cas4 (RecB family)